ncbi:hypothetical protein SLH46_06695 [Draconibacterium sp. IB214405]|uniref:hypothetical protein n=1 Tax=Draconibacterium sp. IB214405 TaxID=3097352 RepID=UPI002A0E5105|nr:hypothetical protein [Draconibacterium sp. IB214405]MDX8338862.1 hypothetical protein [Draconibacterium sp. IB214405]
MKIFGKRKIAYIIYIGIAIVFMIINAILPDSEEEEHIQESYTPATNGQRNINFDKRYNGLVIKKFNDSRNHNEETIEIKLSRGSYFYLHPPIIDKSGFYGFVQEGDSIFKDDWGFTFRVRREGKDTIFIIHPDYINLK